MATLVLGAAGAAIGGALLPAGISVLGQTIGGAAIGQLVGATIGRAIDRRLFAPNQSVEGPRLDGLDVQKSAEGAPLPVIDGHGRVAGQIIWATRLKEVVTTTSESSGGKGSGPKVETTEYTYFANFAVALTDCAMGRVRSFGRIWADGKELDRTGLSIRFYNGTESQNPDSLIVTKDNAAPGYRGVSYVVFEGMPVAEYGNRIPNLTFEVWGQNGEMENLIQGVDMIPGSTEFGYSPSKIIRDYSPGSADRENAFRPGPRSDMALSIDLLKGTLPNCKTVALVVGWFGTDLRAGSCKIRPKVETKSKKLKNRTWQSGGETRSSAQLVSYIDGRPAFGSSPDDESVVDAIQYLNQRGYKVILYPFILMDIPAGNTLPDRDGNTGQPTYPWRGRIGPTTGSNINSQVSSFVGTAQPGHFVSASGGPNYSGPSEWSYRRFILHLAALARQAGGVNAFLIGSELVDMTRATPSSGSYPFVDALVTLAADVSSMLPSAKISYAADWSEYHSHQNGADLYFHLDPLWSSNNIDFVGMDNYLPISDWRPGSDHADFDASLGHTSPYVLDYLKVNIEGGELWDYYYLSDADRDAQIRTPITDGAYSEPWVYRQKAIRDWWENDHHNRPGGVRSATKTGWVPQSKPFWFTEFGCPAVDLGANQPNVFYDGTSSESFLPYFSSGVRDDFIQRQYIRATIEYWTDNGGAMIAPSDMMVWAWDARPWPEFPKLTAQWSDGPNWRRGHWLNGRAGNAPAAEVLARRLKVHYGYTDADFDVSRCYGQTDGLVLPGPLSFREVIAPFETALRLDTAEIDGVLHISSRAAAIPVADYTEADLVDTGGSLYQITESSQEETPRAAVVRYSDTDRDYQAGAARASIRENPGQAESTADLAVVSDLDRMSAVADMMLRTAADGRQFSEFKLPPSSDLKPGDVFTLTPRNGIPKRFIADSVTRGKDRTIRASNFTSSVFGSVGGPVRTSPTVFRPSSETAAVYLMDLPILPLIELADYQGFAVFMSDPWPGGVDLFRSVDVDTGYSLNLRTGSAGSAGETIEVLPPGRMGTWSSEVIKMTLTVGSFVSKSSADVLDGANTLAIEHGPGLWEIVQFRDATLVDVDTWELTGLLRGQLGTEWIPDPGGLASGARVVVINAGVVPVPMTPADIGRTYNWRVVPVGQDVLDGSLISHAFNGAGRRPYAPAFLSADLAGTDLNLSWVRRTRVEGDRWPDVGDVPLGETFERYQIEVGPEGSPVVAQILDDATSTTLDLTGQSGTFEIRVSQVSETYGIGPAVGASITI